MQRRQRPDRFAELLECMADLLIETRRQRVDIAHHRRSDDPRVRDAVTRVAELERSSGTWAPRPRLSTKCFSTCT